MDTLPTQSQMPGAKPVQWTYPLPTQSAAVHIGVIIYLYWCLYLTVSMSMSMSGSCAVHRAIMILVPRMSMCCVGGVLELWRRASWVLCVLR